MKKVGGNLAAELQIKTGTEKNDIGEAVLTWETVNILSGWLDYVSGEAQNLPYSAKIQESTHVFMSDSVTLDSRVFTCNTRMIVNGKVYDVTLIDNPMELNAHLEIYLKFTGDQ